MTKHRGAHDDSPSADSTDRVARGRVIYARNLGPSQAAAMALMSGRAGVARGGRRRSRRALAADITHFFIGVPLWTTVSIYGAVLAVDFVLLYRREKTRSIHDINSRRREVFYWVAVFFTFALSTALGDLTAANWHRGFLGSIVLIAALVTYLSVTHHRRRPRTI